MAEPRGRDGEAVEVKSAGGVSPPAGGGGGVRWASPGYFLKKWCHLVHSEILLGASLNALKHHVYGAWKSYITAPPSPIIRPLLEAFLFFKTSSLWGGEIMSPPPPPKKNKNKKDNNKIYLYRNAVST